MLRGAFACDRGARSDAAVATAAAVTTASAAARAPAQAIFGAYCERVWSLANKYGVYDEGQLVSGQARQRFEPCLYSGVYLYRAVYLYYSAVCLYRAVFLYSAPV